MTTQRLFSFAIVILLFTTSVQAQSNIRIMSYNLLNFPTGNIQGRVDTLKKIVDYYKPQLLMIQELKTEEGLTQVTDMMDDLNYGVFASSQFVPQGNPSGEYNLQQAIVFNQNIFRLKSQHEIVTVLRDVNEFVLYLNNPELEEGADTTFIHVFVTHLKSSTGGANEDMRLSSVNSWLDYVAENLEPTDRVMIAGDFNLYDNSEPAYLALVDPQNHIVMKDVFESFGNWSSPSFAHKNIHTQSTRQDQIFNDGAGGGVDDRFDFIMFSENMMDTDGDIHFTPGTFKSLGNTGNCYNASITNCSANNEVPANVLRAIYYQSDHIPQVCELTTTIPLSVENETRNSGPEILLPQGNLAASLLQVNLLPRTTGQHTLAVMDMTGRLMYRRSVSIPSYGERVDISVDQWPSGSYFLRASNESGQSAVIRFVVVHP